MIPSKEEMNYAYHLMAEIQNDLHKTPSIFTHSSTVETKQFLLSFTSNYFYLLRKENYAYEWKLAFSKRMPYSKALPISFTWIRFRLQVAHIYFVNETQNFPGALILSRGHKRELFLLYQNKRLLEL